MKHRNRSTGPCHNEFRRTEATAVPFPCVPLFEQPPFIIFERLLPGFGSHHRTKRKGLVKKVMGYLRSLSEDLLSLKGPK